eukprot:CFRG8120T1
MSGSSRSGNDAVVGSVWTNPNRSPLVYTAQKNAQGTIRPYIRMSSTVGQMKSHGVVPRPQNQHGRFILKRNTAYAQPGSKDITSTSIKKDAASTSNCIGGMSPSNKEVFRSAYHAAGLPNSKNESDSAGRPPSSPRILQNETAWKKGQQHDPRGTTPTAKYRSSQTLPMSTHFQANTTPTQLPSAQKKTRKTGTSQTVSLFDLVIVKGARVTSKSKQPSKHARTRVTSQPLYTVKRTSKASTSNNSEIGSNARVPETISSATRGAGKSSRWTASANPLDSTAPVRRRGKERLVPKKKRPTAMRKIIMKDREKRRAQRMRVNEGTAVTESGYKLHSDNKNIACVSDEGSTETTDKVKPSSREEGDVLDVSDVADSIDTASNQENTKADDAHVARKSENRLEADVSSEVRDISNPTTGATVIIGSPAQHSNLNQPTSLSESSSAFPPVAREPKHATNMPTINSKTEPANSHAEQSTVTKMSVLHTTTLSINSPVFVPSGETRASESSKFVLSTTSRIFIPKSHLSTSTPTTNSSNPKPAQTRTLISTAKVVSPGANVAIPLNPSYPKPSTQKSAFWPGQISRTCAEAIAQSPTRPSVERKPHTKISVDGIDDILRNMSSERIRVPVAKKTSAYSLSSPHTLGSTHTNMTIPAPAIHIGGKKALTSDIVGEVTNQLSQLTTKSSKSKKKKKKATIHGENEPSGHHHVHLNQADLFNRRVTDFDFFHHSVTLVNTCRYAIVGAMHVAKFRGYCKNDVTKELSGIVAKLTQEVANMHHKKLQNDPAKANYRRRYAKGIREVLKALRSGVVRCVIIPTDIENVSSDYGLNDQLRKLMDLCEEKEVRVVYAMTRKSLGDCLIPKAPVSVVSIHDYSGAHTAYNELLKLLTIAQQTYNAKLNTHMATCKGDCEARERNIQEANRVAGAWKELVFKSADVVIKPRQRYTYEFVLTGQDFYDTRERTRIAKNNSSTESLSEDIAASERLRVTVGCTVSTENGDIRFGVGLMATGVSDTQNHDNTSQGNTQKQLPSTSTIQTSSVSVILAARRVASDEALHQDIWECEKSGTYVLEFDNSYSHSKSKVLRFEVTKTRTAL